MARIFIVMGKSATGKDTVYNHLLNDPQLKLEKIVLYTTRPKRKNEVDGEEYNFVDDTMLKKLLADDKVIECRTYETVYGPWSYFTVDDGNINLESKNYIMIGTVEAYIDLKKYFGESKAYPLYIEVDDGIRLSRALGRELNQETPKYSEMCRRYLADEIDFSDKQIEIADIKKRYSNNCLEQCLLEIKNDIKNIM
ncbi:MAG TPA: guanylate kinase [Clostridiales bacterium]|nr:guanylate kinase [Clostridiales bacterium]